MRLSILDYSDKYSACKVGVVNLSIGINNCRKHNENCRNRAVLGKWNSGVRAIITISVDFDGAVPLF